MNRLAISSISEPPEEEEDRDISVKCSNDCTEDPQVYCVDCQGFFCGECLEKHDGLKKMRDHTKKPVVDLVEACVKPVQQSGLTQSQELEQTLQQETTKIRDTARATHEYVDEHINRYIRDLEAERRKLHERVTSKETDTINKLTGEVESVTTRFKTISQEMASPVTALRNLEHLSTTVSTMQALQTQNPSVVHVLFPDYRPVLGNLQSTMSPDEHEQNQKKILLTLGDTVRNWSMDIHLRHFQFVSLNNRLNNRQVEKIRLYGVPLNPSLPPTIGKLKRLKCLNMNSCGLTTLPSEIGELASLVDLDLQNNRLTTLPVEIGRLTELNHLNLRGNLITELPTEIGSLTSLWSVSLSNNKLRSLPSSVSQWAMVKRVWLHDNELTELPRGILIWPRLEHLELQNNNLQGEVFIPNPSGLQQLIFYGNPEATLPPEDSFPEIRVYRGTHEEATDGEAEEEPESI